MLRYEIQLVQERTRVINFLHSLTDKYDVDPKEGGSVIWREKTLKFLEGVRPEDPSDQFVLERCIARIRNVKAEAYGKVQLYNQMIDTAIDNGYGTPRIVQVYKPGPKTARNEGARR